MFHSIKIITRSCPIHHALPSSCERATKFFHETNPLGFLFIIAQNDTIKLRVPRKAIPGSIGAFVYLTGVY